MGQKTIQAKRLKPAAQLDHLDRPLDMMLQHCLVTDEQLANVNIPFYHKDEGLPTSSYASMIACDIVESLSNSVSDTIASCNDRRHLSLYCRASRSKYPPSFSSYLAAKCRHAARKSRSRRLTSAVARGTQIVVMRRANPLAVSMQRMSGMTTVTSGRECYSHCATTILRAGHTVIEEHWLNGVQGSGKAHERVCPSGGQDANKRGMLLALALPFLGLVLDGL